MRRSKLFLFALVIALCSVLFCGIKFKATDLLTSDDILVKGAQVRTSDPMGIRFVASSSYVELESTEDGYVDYKYGVVIAFGELGQDDVLALTTESINGYSLLNAEVDSMDEDNQFYISLVNIPEEMYGQKVTARAYVKADDTVTYATEVVVRSFNYVVKEVYESGTGNDIVAELYSELPLTTVNYNLDGGDFKTYDEFTIGGYNTYRSSGDYAYTAITTPASTSTNRYWHRILVKEVTAGIYKAVYSIAVADAGAAGTTVINGVTVPTGNTSNHNVDFDYIIGANSSTGYDKTVFNKIKNLMVEVANGNELYFSFSVPTSTSTNSIDVKVHTATDLLKGNTLKYLETLNELPEAKKIGYNFVGWFDNKELSGEKVTTIEKANVATTLDLYAKYEAINYGIVWDLGEGTCSVDLPETYNIETETITLPTASDMILADAEFIGWVDASGSTVTEISKGTIGDIELTAQWTLLAAQEYAIEDTDAAALNSIYNDKEDTATIIVDSTFTSTSKYILTNVNLDSAYADVEYVYGTNLFSSVADALSAAEADSTIYLFAGEYSLSAKITKSVTIIGPNMDLKVSDEKNDEALIKVAKDVAGNLAAKNIIFNGVHIKGTGGGAGVAGKTFQDGGNIEKLVFKSCEISDTNTLFKLEGTSNLELLFEDCHIHTIGQFIVWATKGINKTILKGNYVDGSTCGAVTNAAAALFRIRFGSLEAYNNVFNGDSKNEPGYFECSASDSVVKYNTFKNVTKYVYSAKANYITFNENLYLDANGTALTAAPETLTGTGVTADTKVAKDAEELKQLYESYLESLK